VSHPAAVEAVEAVVGVVGVAGFVVTDASQEILLITSAHDKFNFDVI